MLGRHGRHDRRLLGHVPIAVAVELEEQRRCHAIRGLRVAVDGVDLHVVQELDPGDRHPLLDGGDHRVHRPLDGVERADGGRDCLRQGMQAERDIGDHAERAFRADEQPRQVVAGRRLPGPRPGLDDAAIGQHRGHAEHVLAHGAVADGRGARGAGGRHPAEGGVGARIDGEGQAGVPQRLGELQPRHPGLDGRIEILRADPQHVVHVAKVDRDAAAQRVHVAFERGARAERDDRHLKAPADFYDAHDVLRRGGEADDVGQGGRMVGLAVAVMFAHCRVVAGARAEQPLELRNSGVDSAGLGHGGHRHQCSLPGLFSPGEGTFPAARRVPAGRRGNLCGTVLAGRFAVTVERLLGRSVAFCVHPYAAWRRLPVRGRALLVGAYFGTAYTVVLVLLFAA